jgi:hypothetical protein
VFKSSCSLTIDSENGRTLQIKHYQSTKNQEDSNLHSNENDKKTAIVQTSPSVTEWSQQKKNNNKDPKDVKGRIKYINKQTIKEQQTRKRAKNLVRNMSTKIDLKARKSLQNTPSTPRFAPKKEKHLDTETGLNDLYSWINNASSLQVINNGHHMAKGTFSGKAQIMSLAKDDSKSLSPHDSKILAMHYDYDHHLCLSVSANMFQVQKENSQGYSSIRKLRLKNFPQEPSLVTLSVPLNMIIFISSMNQIFIVDYEFLRVFARVYVPCISIPSPRSKNNEEKVDVCKLEIRYLLKKTFFFK